MAPAAVSFGSTTSHSARACFGKQNRGVAVGYGRVLFGTADNHMVALDQKTGAELWRVNVEDSRQCGCDITGAPLLVKDIVVTGVTGGDSAHRGYLTAFDVKTGRMRWRFYTIPGPGEPGHETWPGESWRYGGGSTWMTGSYDPELNLLYWGVGNASSDINGSNRGGDNLYTASIVALDADTGKLKWYYQEVPHDVWDYDAAFELYLVDLPLKGRTRKVLMQATKTGYVWMLDRTNGEFLKAWPFAKHINWVSGITEDGKLVGRLEPQLGTSKLVCPSVVGAKNWNQGAFSPRTGWLYLPVQELCNDLIARNEQVPEGEFFAGGQLGDEAAAGRQAGGLLWPPTIHSPESGNGPSRSPPGSWRRCSPLPEISSSLATPKATSSPWTPKPEIGSGVSKPERGIVDRLSPILSAVASMSPRPPGGAPSSPLCTKTFGQTRPRRARVRH